MVAESLNESIEQDENNAQGENVVATLQAEKVEDNLQVEKVEKKTSSGCGKKMLTPYQQYKNSRNPNGKKYFEFYDDVKVYTHNIWDW